MSDRLCIWKVLTLLFVAALCLTLPGCGAPTPIDYQLKHTYAVRDPQFLRTIGRLLGPPLLDGNKITTLVNGDAIFPAMLEAIRAAKQTITLETFIYWSGEIGGAFTDALAERARAGVKVHLIIDGFGSSQIDVAFRDKLREAGVDVVDYHPIGPLTWDKLNFRTHRKILVVDGKVGFTGGVGIADEWGGNATDPKHWRDNHYKVEGPVVASLQGAFADNWIEAKREVLDGEPYFPRLEPAGDLYAQVFISSPSGGSASMQLMYLLSINAAEKSIYLASPYFVLDAMTMSTLKAARARGVEINVIVPGEHIDSQVMSAASRSQWGELLELGVRIHQYQPCMYHTKVMVVDEQWTSVGSTNLDNRSFHLNDEANLNVYDSGFAAEQVRILKDDIANSTPVTLENWDNRSFLRRVLDSLAGMLAPHL